MLVYQMVKKKHIKTNIVCHHSTHQNCHVGSPVRKTHLGVTKNLCFLLRSQRLAAELDLRVSGGGGWGDSLGFWAMKPNDKPFLDGLYTSIYGDLGDGFMCDCF